VEPLPCLPLAKDSNSVGDQQPVSLLQQAETRLCGCHLSGRSMTGTHKAATAEIAAIPAPVTAPATCRSTVTDATRGINRSASVTCMLCVLCCLDQIQICQSASKAFISRWQARLTSRRALLHPKRMGRTYMPCSESFK